jgi:Cu(I)/Ag(I) efflux system protein CusF
MKVHFKNTIPALALVLALTFALAVLPGVVRAAEHGAHGHGHAQTTASPEARQIYTATGIIKSIDQAANRVVIAHGPVPALGWPGMTMGFVFEDASLLDGLQTGDQVRFDFRPEPGNVFVIVDIEARS